MKTNLALSQLVKSFHAIKKNPVMLAYPILSDLIFLFLYGFLSGIFINKIIFYFSSVYDLMIDNAGAVKSDFMSKGIIYAIIHVKGASLLLGWAALWMALFIAFIYALYCAFQSISWAASIAIAGSTRLKGYKKRFFQINLFWLLFFILYNAVSIPFGFRKHVVSRYVTVPDHSIGLILFIAVLSYFIIISYSLIERYPAKKSIKLVFSIGIKHVKHLIPMYLIIIAAFLSLSLISLIFGAISSKPALILGILFTFLLFAWARVYSYLVVSRLVE